MPAPIPHLSRRAALKCSLGVLLGGGFWPGRQLTHAADRSASFRFLVVNDTHCSTPECGPWLRRLVAQMRTHTGVAFCLHLGDITDRGDQENLIVAREAFAELGVPFHPVPGNHDWERPNSRETYDAAFPNRLTYGFEHQGWEFLALDSTHGQLWERTRVQTAALDALDQRLAQIDRSRPLILFTHFPLAHLTPMTPLNADAVLERLLRFDLRAAFSGHHHGFTESRHRSAMLVTNRCCARIRDNHDGTPGKGYWLCSVQDGRLDREFVPFKPGTTA